MTWSKIRFDSTAPSLQAMLNLYINGRGFRLGLDALRGRKGIDIVVYTESVCAMDV
jgi:hypothetical protein